MLVTIHVVAEETWKDTHRIETTRTYLVTIITINTVAIDSLVSGCPRISSGLGFTLARVVRKSLAHVPRGCRAHECGDEIAVPNSGKAIRDTRAGLARRSVSACQDTLGRRPVPSVSDATRCRCRCEMQNGL